MRDAGIADPADVHYVQTKTPLLTIESVRDAQSRGQDVACEVHNSMGVSNGTTGLGIAVALGEIEMPKAEEICHNLDLYSSVASCSSGVELTQAQIVLLGNKPAPAAATASATAVMKDALDIDGIYDAIRNAGLELPERPRAEDLNGTRRQLLHEMRGRPRGTLRGRRQIMLDDSDVHHHRHSKAAVGGVAAAAIGDPAVFVSVDAMHQGPQGGGPVIAIVDAGESDERHRTCANAAGVAATHGLSQIPENGAMRSMTFSTSDGPICGGCRQRSLFAMAPAMARRCRPAHGQGQGRRVPDLFVAAVFRRDRPRLLQGTQHRAGNHQADGRPAERRGADHQPDRSLRGAGDARRPQRQRQEAGRGDVHRHAQPERRPTRWSSSWCARALPTRSSRSRTSRASS